MLARRTGAAYNCGTETEQKPNIRFRLRAVPTPSPRGVPMSAGVISPEAFLANWQGHRRLTRRVIEAFPEDQLNTFSVGGMRTFGALAMEMLAIGVPLLRGILTGDWDAAWDRAPLSKAELLREWDEATPQLDELWKQLSPDRYEEEVLAFGQYPGKVYDQLLYAVENEIHHRAQGYVYLRALGIEPPAFYDRS